MHAMVRHSGRLKSSRPGACICAVLLLTLLAGIPRRARRGQPALPRTRAARRFAACYVRAGRLEQVGQFAGHTDPVVTIADLRDRGRKDHGAARAFVDAERLGSERLPYCRDAAQFFPPMTGQHGGPVAAFDAALGPEAMTHRVVDFQSGEALRDGEASCSCIEASGTRKFIDEIAPDADFGFLRARSSAPWKRSSRHCSVSPKLRGAILPGCCCHFGGWVRSACSWDRPTPDYLKRFGLERKAPAQGSDEVDDGVLLF